MSLFPLGFPCNVGVSGSEYWIEENLKPCCWFFILATESNILHNILCKGASGIVSFVQSLTSPSPGIDDRISIISIISIIYPTHYQAPGVGAPLPNSTTIITTITTEKLVKLGYTTTTTVQVPIDLHVLFSDAMDRWTEHLKLNFPETTRSTM